MSSRPEDVQATFCATLVDEWARCGVTQAVVAPGSRSTPLALALATDDRIAVQVHLDERSAGFVALGSALATGEPAVVLTTSGTAAAELHSAVVEADLAGVALLVCTADRPPELVDVGAPQAIDQTRLYGGSTRWAHDPGVAAEAAQAHWRPLASRAYAEATGSRPGPVHLNLPFREPLLGTPGELPPSRSVEGAPWTWAPAEVGVVESPMALRGELSGHRGLIVAGAGSGDGASVAAVAEALGWPILAAPQADVWRTDSPALIPHADAILRTDVDLAPEVIVQLGGGLASRVAGEWLAASGAIELVVPGAERWDDPHGTAALVLRHPPDAVLAGWIQDLELIAPVDDGAWLGRWRAAGRSAAAAVDSVLDACVEPSEPGVARDLVAALPAGASLVVSSSMPIRDVEWYVRPGVDVEVLANRGANGIDGVVSTAVGVALTGGPAALLVGDLAFLHDSNGLVGAAHRGIDLVVVVVDNDGGGIFSFLPQAGSVDPARFEQLYGTPHGLDLVAVAAALGASAAPVRAVGPAVEAALAVGGVHVLVVSTDRATNRDLHAAINAEVANVLVNVR